MGEPTWKNMAGPEIRILARELLGGSDNEDANEHIEKILEIVDLFHIPNITRHQVMLRAFPMSLTGAASRWLRNKPAGLITTWEILKEKFLTWERFMELLLRCLKHYLTFYAMRLILILLKDLRLPTRPNSCSKVSFHLGKGCEAIESQSKEMARSFSNNDTMGEHLHSGVKGPHYTKDCPLKEEGKTLAEAYYTQFGIPGSSKEDHTKQKLQDSTKETMGTLHRVEENQGALNSVIRIWKIVQKNRANEQGRPFLSTVHAKIDVFKRKITLRVGNDKIVFKSEKPTRNIIKRVYVLSLRERMELDLEARLMGEALILNRSQDSESGNYIELNDLNEPIELRRNQVDDLEPTIKEGEVIDGPIMDIIKTRSDNEIIDGLDEYPSYCDFDRKIHINYPYNL
ncbi:hypothetical protein Tco_0163850 [Tanacetum coccineum]